MGCGQSKPAGKGKKRKGRGRRKKGSKKSPKNAPEEPDAYRPSTTYTEGEDAPPPGTYDPAYDPTATAGAPAMAGAAAGQYAEQPPQPEPCPPEPEPPAPKQQYRPSPKKPVPPQSYVSPEGMKYHAYKVELQQDGSFGFQYESRSLMITHVLHADLKQQSLPEGSTIRKVNDCPVFDNEQFRRETEGKSWFFIVCVLPGPTSSVWKVRPGYERHTIDVHPEALAVLKSDIPRFPVEMQVIQAVDGVPVYSWRQYQRETCVGGEPSQPKNKYFITTCPIPHAALPDQAIDKALRDYEFGPCLERMQLEQLENLLKCVQHSQSVLENEYIKRFQKDIAMQESGRPSGQMVQ